MVQRQDVVHEPLSSIFQRQFFLPMHVDLYNRHVLLTESQYTYPTTDQQYDNVTMQYFPDHQRQKIMTMGMTQMITKSERVWLEFMMSLYHYLQYGSCLQGPDHN